MPTYDTLKTVDANSLIPVLDPAGHAPTSAFPVSIAQQAALDTRLNLDVSAELSALRQANLATQWPGAVSLAGAVSLESFGADPTGVSDSSAALTSALATGKAVFSGGPDKEYLFASSVIVPANGNIFGFESKFKTTSNIPILKLSTGATIQGIKFEGNSTGSLQRGIFIDGGITYDEVLQTRTTLCTFSDFGASGYYVTRVVASHEGHHLSNSLFTGCATGIDIDERGEYTLIVGCNIDTCTVGIRINGGNTQVTGGVISDSTDGVLIEAGSNDAHGSVSDVLINHCSRAVRVTEITVSEFSFNNCRTYFGGIQIYNADRVSFNDCVFDATGQITFQNSYGTCFHNCHFSAVPTFNHDFSSTTSKTYFVNCKLPDGSAIQKGGLLLAKRITSDAVITSSATAQAVEFNSVAASMPLQAAYTHDDLWDEAGFNAQNLAAIQSPDCGITPSVTVSIRVGTDTGNADTIDFDKVNCYIQAADTGVFLANLSTPNFHIGTTPGLAYKRFTFSGRLPLAEYQVMVKNDSGFALVVFIDEGTSDQSFLKVEEL